MDFAVTAGCGEPFAIPRDSHHVRRRAVVQRAQHFPRAHIVQLDFSVVQSNKQVRSVVE